jgi:hypothetical protein
MIDDEQIRAVVTRLSRHHPSGGMVVERAAVIAEGCDSAAILSWIAAHDGQPEALSPSKSSGGLHHSRSDRAADTDARPPRRYVLPPDALT